MKLPVTGETPCTLTTQSECRLAASVLGELPTDKYQHGKHGMFFYCTPADYYAASRISMHGDLLNATLQYALTHPAVHGALGRRTDTLHDFPAYGLTCGEFDILLSGALLVATQSPTEGREKETTPAIENARLLGFLMMHAGADEYYQASHTNLFRVRSADPEHGYRESATIAAQRLEHATADEFVHAGPSAPLTPPEGYVSPVATALQNYQAENPLIHQFATATS